MDGPGSLNQFSRAAGVIDGETSLAGIALLIAAMEYPDLDPAPYVAQLDDLADEARTRLRRESSAHGIANALSHFLLEEQQFTGNTSDYYDPRNSFLNDVLDRRTGIPITLSLVYVEVARRAGAIACGIGLPGHFVVRVDAAADEVLVDPFHGGTILTSDDCLALMAQSAAYTGPLDPSFLQPVTNRDFSARMLNNLKSIYMNAQDYPRALAVVERLLILHSDDTRERRLRDALLRVTSP
jgi:regulator of sirC expression with transglutaminase-like and TPR domain